MVLETTSVDLEGMPVRLSLVCQVETIPTAVPTQTTMVGQTYKISCRTMQVNGKILTATATEIN